MDRRPVTREMEREGRPGRQVVVAEKEAFVPCTFTKSIYVSKRFSLEWNP